jgi:hypothetical protein
VDGLIITETEQIRLHQLKDREHRLTIARGDRGFMITHDDHNEWARETVRDWRAQHALDCLCLKHHERVYL